MIHCHLNKSYRSRLHTYSKDAICKWDAYRFATVFHNKPEPVCPYTGLALATWKKDRIHQFSLFYCLSHATVVGTDPFRRASRKSRLTDLFRVVCLPHQLSSGLVGQVVRGNLRQYHLRSTAEYLGFEVKNDGRFNENDIHVRITAIGPVIWSRWFYC